MHSHIWIHSWFSSRGILLPNTSLFLHAALVEICRRCWHWARLSSCYQDSHWHWMPRLGPTIRWFEKSSHSRPQQATVWKGFSSVICVAFRLNSHEAFSSFSFGISQGLRPTLGFLCRSTNCRMGSEHLELLELSVFFGTLGNWFGECDFVSEHRRWNWPSPASQLTNGRLEHSNQLREVHFIHFSTRKDVTGWEIVVSYVSYVSRTDEFELRMPVFAEPDTVSSSSEVHKYFNWQWSLGKTNFSWLFLINQGLKMEDVHLR